jgi:DegV family protein with EDD domain
MIQYKLVTDSSANLTAEWAREVLGTEIGFASVPLKIHTTSAEFTDDETLDLSEMVEALRHNKGPSGSACPNIAEWTSAFGDAEFVFAYTISSNLSGSYASAMQAAADYMEAHAERRVYVFDSLSTGPEMQLMIEKTQELILAGKTFDEIVNAVLAYQKRTRLTFSLESLMNLAANGRVKPAVAKIAGVLGIRVLATASDVGTIEMLKKAPGERMMLRSMWEIMRECGYKGGKVRLAHCFNEGAAKALADIIRKAFGSCDIRILPCRGLCSFYAEKGGILIGFETAGV